MNDIATNTRAAELSAPLRPKGRNDAPAGPSTAQRRRKIAARVQRALLGLLVLCGAAAIVMSFLPDPIPADLARTATGPLTVTLDEEARTRVQDRYVISAPVLANLQRIKLSAGDRVEAGDVLATLAPLDPPMLDARSHEQAIARIAAATAARQRAHAEVERAAVALQYARTELERELALGQRGATASHSVEQARLQERTAQSALASLEFAAKVADHELEMARLQLRAGTPAAASATRAQIEIRAPVGGQVLRVLHTSGGVVQPGTELLELGDLARLEIVADVLTADAVPIEPGATATIEHWGGPQPLAAHVKQIEPSAFTRISALGVEEQRVRVVLELDSPRTQWAALGDGYRVDARIVLWHRDDVLTLPASALFRSAEHWAVYAVGHDGRAHLTKVNIGQRNDERAEILSGLAHGATVIVHPSDRITDGARVKQR